MSWPPSRRQECEARSQRRDAEPRIRWIDDRLPDLNVVHRLGLAFDVIMLSAVWMHVAPSARVRAFRKVSTLLKPGGVLLISLREGPSDPDRMSAPQMQRLHWPPRVTWLALLQFPGSISAMIRWVSGLLS
jgi:SAM-dependent methyltransferase